MSRSQRHNAMICKSTFLAMCVAFVVLPKFRVRNRVSMTVVFLQNWATYEVLPSLIFSFTGWTANRGQQSYKTAG